MGGGVGKIAREKETTEDCPSPLSSPSVSKRAESQTRMLRSRIASTLARSAAAGPSAAPALAVPRLARSVQTTADSSSLIDHGDEHVKVKLHEEYFKAHRCEPPALELEVPKQQLVDIYREMVQFVSPSLSSLSVI